MPWADEVLVGRGDINEKRERMSELEAQVRLQVAVLLIVCGACAILAAGTAERVALSATLHALKTYEHSIIM
jgi:hypothetical protein